MYVCIYIYIISEIHSDRGYKPSFSLGVFPLFTIWGFPKMGVPQNGRFVRENLIKMDDDWGYPYFRKPPYVPTIFSGRPARLMITQGSDGQQKRQWFLSRSPVELKVLLAVSWFQLNSRRSYIYYKPKFLEVESSAAKYRAPFSYIYTYLYTYMYLGMTLTHPRTCSFLSQFPGSPALFSVIFRRSQGCQLQVSVVCTAWPCPHYESLEWCFFLF